MDNTKVFIQARTLAEDRCMYRPERLSTHMTHKDVKVLTQHTPEGHSQGLQVHTGCSQRHTEDLEGRTTT